MKSIEQAVGRLILGRLPGTILGAEHRRLLSAGRMGGICLFKENGKDLRQLAALTKDIIETSSHVPVLTVDQEGGAVQRFEHIITPLPSPMALAALPIERLKEIAAISARQLKTLGFNLLLAPTLDLLPHPLNPIICTRAFGADKDLVAKAGLAYIQALEENGMVACGKHFPGHGSTAEDSHLTLANVPKSKAALLESDLVPFQKTLASLSSILVGHIWLPEIDEKPLPATLSTKIVRDLLIKEMGYSGLIVSDDMLMKGLTNEFGLSEACVKAVEAGLDLLLVLGTAEESADAHAALVKAVRSGRISESRLEASIKKLDHLFPKKPAYLDPQENEHAFNKFVRTIDDDREVCLKASSEAVCLIKGGKQQEKAQADLKALVSEGEEILVYVPEHVRYPMRLARYIGQDFNQHGDLKEIRYPLNPSAETAETLAKRAREKKAIFLTFRAFINKGQFILAEKLAGYADQIVHVSTDSPYDLRIMKDSQVVSHCLALNDPSDLAMHGLSQVFAGLSQAQGKITVDI